MFGRLKSDKTEKGLSRSIDGMKGSRAVDGASTVLDAHVLPWRTGGASDDYGAEVERVNAERQQSRIINFFSVDQKELVTPEEIVGLGSRALAALKRERAEELKRKVMEDSDPKATAEERRKFLRRLKRGEITTADEAEFLLLIRDPLNIDGVGAVKMFDKVAADPRQTQILAVAAGYNLNNWQKIDKEALVKILSAVQSNGDDYRTPVGFASLRRYFLKGIKPKAGEKVYRRYVQSMNELEQTMYGMRWEYYKQFENLRKMAKEELTEDEKVPEVIRRSVERPKVKLVAISSEKSAEMLGKAVIQGDAWKNGGVERTLGAYNLSEAKLEPKYEVSLKDVKICVSDLFQLGNGQIGTIAYVLTGENIKVRTFYRNVMQGLWRYAPDYLRKNDGGVDKFLLGYGEESILLPFEAQEMLVMLEQEKGVRNLAVDGVSLPAEFFGAGTAFGYDSVQEYQTAWNYGRLKGDFYREVSSDPINHDLGASGSRAKKAPYTLSIDFDRAPDFEARGGRFETHMVDAGSVEVEEVPSHDGQLRWWFCRDSRGRVWIEHVEVLAPVTSLGLRQNWVAMGDFTTGLYEHTTKAGIYGDRDDTKGARQCMWKNYLSNVPIIREYRELK